MKKNLPKTIAIILLTIIALLILYISTGGLLPTKTPDNGGANANTDTPAPPPIIDDNGSSGNQNDDILSTATTLPKAPLTSDLYAYTQTISASNSVKLNASFMTSVGVFVIVSASSKSGDIVNKNQGVVIFKMNYDGTLTARLHLETSSPSYFVAAAITSGGIAIITNEYDDNNIVTRSNFYIISYDLKDKVNIPLTPLNDAKFFVQSEGFILFAERKDSAIYYIKDKAIVSSTAIQSGKIQEVLAFSNYFTIIINGADNYSVITLNAELTNFQSKIVTSAICLKLIPYSKDKLQRYISVEKCGNEIYLKDYNASFSKGRSLGVGYADSVQVAFNGASIFLLLSADNQHNLYMYDTNINTLFNKFDCLKTMQQLYSCLSYKDGYVLLFMQKDKTLSLIDIRNNGSSALNNLNFSVASATLLRTPDNKILVLSEVANGVNITAISL